MFFIYYLSRVLGELFSSLPHTYSTGYGTYMEVWPTSKYVHYIYTFRNLENDSGHHEPDLGQDSISDPIYHHSNRLPHSVSQYQLGFCVHGPQHIRLLHSS